MANITLNICLRVCRGGFILKGTGKGPVRLVHGLAGGKCGKLLRQQKMVISTPKMLQGVG